MQTKWNGKQAARLKCSRPTRRLIKHSIKRVLLELGSTARRVMTTSRTRRSSRSASVKTVSMVSLTSSFFPPISLSNFMYLWRLIIQQQKRELSIDKKTSQPRKFCWTYEIRLPTYLHIINSSELFIFLEWDLEGKWIALIVGLNIM